MDATNRKTEAVPQLPDAAISALRQGRRIEAIKIVREERDIGLREAKEAVDAYVRSQPALQAGLDAAQSEARRNAMRWLAVLIVVAVLAYYFLARP